MIYEYAGFNYIIDVVRGKAIATPFQHQAAYKEKHARNAYKEWYETNNNN